MTDVREKLDRMIESIDAQRLTGESLNAIEYVRELADILRISLDDQRLEFEHYKGLAQPR